MQVLAAVMAPTLALTFGDESVNWAAGRRVVFAPQPNYAITSDGHDDTDLTDGRLCDRRDNRLWMDPGSVGWSYTPCFRLAVDLGEVRSVGTVGLHLMGGGATDGADFPTWARLAASVDGEHWFELDRFQREGAPASGTDAVPPSAGEAWTRWLRLAKRAFRARYIGIELGGTAFTCADEFEVRGCAANDAADLSSSFGRPCQFDMATPSVSFLKWSLHGAEDVFLPQPFQVLNATSDGRRTLRLSASFPNSLEFGGIVLGGKGMQVTSRQAHGIGRTVVSAELPIGLGGFPRDMFGQCFLRGPRGAASELRIWVNGQDEAEAAVASVAFHHIPGECPNTTGLMTSLGWYPAALLQQWPQRLEAFSRLGLNTVSAFASEAGPDQTIPAVIQQSRDRGFKIALVDSPWHVLLEQSKDDPEPRCQVTGGAEYCPAYGGPRLEAELRRVSMARRALDPDYYFADVELWGPDGPSESKRCVRCRDARLKTPGVSVDEWYLGRGTALWSALRGALEGSSQTDSIALGSYDFRAGLNYQRFWPVDQLLREGAIQSVQPSYYSGLLPRDIRLIETLVRQQVAALRTRCPSAACYVWLTPGDAGAVTRESMRCAVLASFANGARGILFWTRGCWDGEGLLGLADAMNTVSLARGVLLNGLPLAVRCADAASSATGWCRGDEIAVYVGRYDGPEAASVEVELEVPVASELIDCSSGRTIGRVGAGRQRISVSLGTHRSALILLIPVATTPGS